MKSIILLLLMSSAAMAQSTVALVSTFSCTANGVSFHGRVDGSCHIEDMKFGVITATNQEPSQTSATMTSVTISAAPHNCPRDRVMVMDQSGRAKCAKDLTDPE